jgi:ABC-type uncharacterized transport system substrate-binding protein
MLPTITGHEFIARSTRMPHFPARLSTSASSHHDLSLAGFITNIAESDFRYTQLIVAGDALFLHAIKKLAVLAVQYRIAAVFTSRQYAQAGGLITYGASVIGSFRQAGVYAGRILRGEKPGDLPVMQPTKFELVINLQAAKAIGLDVPPLEVIE